MTLPSKPKDPKDLSNSTLFSPLSIDLAIVVDWLERSDPSKVKRFFDTIYDKPARAIRHCSNQELEVVRLLTVIGFREASVAYQQKAKERITYPSPRKDP